MTFKYRNLNALSFATLDCGYIEEANLKTNFWSYNVKCA